MPRIHLALVTIVLCLASDVEAGKRKAPPPEIVKGPNVTTLRAGVPSYVLSGRSAQREVRYVSVQVANIGDVVAKDIVVLLPAAAGLAFPLRGPKKLAPRASAVYVSTIRVPAGVALRNHAVTTCSTCRR